MSELWAAVEVFSILLGSAAFGVFVQHFLSDAHKSRETRELSQAVTNMLVTLAALVLGLLTSSVVESFNRAGNDLNAYAVELIGLGQSLHEFGSEGDPARSLLRTYVANAIASTWPGEPKPPGAGNLGDLKPAGPPHPSLESETLGAVLDRAGQEIRRLPASDPLHTMLAAKAVQQFEQLAQDRWDLLEEARTSIPVPFYRVLVFWLMIVFASLGLIAPRNVLALALLTLAALAIASVIFAIMEMDTPFSGLISVSSAPMRDALAHLSE
ncbi:MAG: hypothetical protein JO157_09785 [Acetobacteraceae bacterium]|nr:hypothetical protein [Acetobacteraceae bacterium]